MVEIIEETQRESIVNRPYNLVGSIKKIESERFNITKTSINYGVSTVVPALLKLFMEALDNPIDIHIKYNACNKINIDIDNKSIRVKDNGIGVSTEKEKDGEYTLYKAFCKYNTSSNYKETKGQGQKGVNGLGISLCTTLSSKFTVISEDKNNRLRIKVLNNNSHHTIDNMVKKNATGVEVVFEPDFNIFEGFEINQAHIDRMYEYTLMQALTYPDIQFTFNKKRVSITPKQFMKLLDINHIIEETDDYFIGILPNSSGEFKQLSYVNGLEINKGGTHVSVVTDFVTKFIQDKLIRKYKSIKRNDIKTKLMFVMIAKNMKNIDWEGQTKNNIASTPSVIKKYLFKTDLTKLSERVYKNTVIIDSVVDYFKIKEEYQKNKDLKNVGKVKKITSDKYLPSIGKSNYLFIAEGQCLSENTKILNENYYSIPIGKVNVGDVIISGDNTKQTIIAKTKLLKKTKLIKTNIGNFAGTNKHKMYVYNTKEQIFEFVTIKKMYKNKHKYKLVKSKINTKTKGVIVISNNNNNIITNENTIKYTSNDYFMLQRNSILIRTKGINVVTNDIILLSE